MTARELYGVDFFEWTERNAELLSRGCFDQADIPHIAEELTDMGSRDQREAESYLKRLMMHLLKWQIPPARSLHRNGLSPTAFPAKCPYCFDQAMDFEFIPS